MECVRQLHSWQHKLTPLSLYIHIVNYKEVHAQTPAADTEHILKSKWERGDRNANDIYFGESRMRRDFSSFPDASD